MSMLHCGPVMATVSQATGAPNTLLGRVQLNATPWYMHVFTWTIAVIAAVLAGLVTLQSRRKE
jgi:hypothetical protein